MAEEKQVIENGRILLCDPERVLLEEIADEEMDREDVAMTYRLALKAPADTVDWSKVNRAILARWSRRDLVWIKNYAWGVLDA